MRIAIVVIGHELLNGDLADTNTQRLAARLRRVGLRVLGAETVPDVLPEITAALGRAAARSDVVLVSGGLGPTSDDLTLEAAAALVGAPLVQHPPTLAAMQARFAARGIPMPPNNARQAMVPGGAGVFENPAGTAPHVQLQVGEARLFFFPGVPRELDVLADTYLMPWLEGHGVKARYQSRAFKTFGQTESGVAMTLAPVEAMAGPDLHVAYRAHFPEIHVSLHATHAEDDARAAALDRAGAKVEGLLGALIFTQDPAESLPEVVGRLLSGAGETVAVAESCTGGLIGGALTSVSGSSAWFPAGFVTYANDAKTRDVGVDPALIAAHGAVSEQVACAMAEGARERACTTWALAVTGIAGPGGGTPEKPVGTVHFALAGPRGTTHAMKRLPWDRERNRTVAVHSALDMLRRALIPS